MQLFILITISHKPFQRQENEEFSRQDKATNMLGTDALHALTAHSREDKGCRNLHQHVVLPSCLYAPVAF